MTVTIDPLTDPSGWSAAGGAAVMPANTWPDFCAGGQSQSVLFSFAAGKTPGTQYVQKTISFDASSAEEVVFSCLSVRQGGEQFDQQSDFLYQIDFGDGKPYLFPTWGTFTHVTIPIALFGTTSLSRIRITYLGSNSDYLVISWMVANNEDFPIDVMTGVQTGLQAAFLQSFGQGIAIGTVTGGAGDKQITVTGSYAFLQRYAVILISDGVNSETHQLSNVNGPVAQLESTYDGGTLKYAHAGAQVYVSVPVQVARTEQSPPLPGIVVWSQEPEPILLGHDFQQTVICWGPSGPALLTEGRNEKWIVQIDATAVQGQAQAAAASVIRWWLSRHVVWVNGAKLEFTWRDRAEEIEPTDPVELIPKVQYTLEIEVREDVWLLPTPPAVAGTSGQVVNVQETLTLP